MNKATDIATSLFDVASAVLFVSLSFLHRNTMHCYTIYSCKYKSDEHLIPISGMK